MCLFTAAQKLTEQGVLEYMGKKIQISSLSSSHSESREPYHVERDVQVTRVYHVHVIYLYNLTVYLIFFICKARFAICNDDTFSKN